MPRSKKGKKGASSKGSLRQEVLQLQLSGKSTPRSGRNGVKAESGVSDDDLASEVLSHYSSASESASVIDEGTAGGEVVDEQTAQEETEDKLKQCIDNVMDKSVKVRMSALDSLRQAFSSRLLVDFLLERRLTLSDCLERCLRKGGGEEQAAAATVCALLCVQLGGGPEGEEGFKVLRPILSSILIDDCASLSARQSCARALGMCCYVSSAEDAEAWALLITLCPASHLSNLINHHLPRLQACLDSADVNFRIAVGETIALLYELGRDIDRDFEYEDSDSLCDALKSLATDGNKHRAKNDRRKQRSIFREVLQYIENEDFSEERIRFGVEALYIDCWVRRRIYDAFKEVSESGVRHHLQWNPLLRDIFGFGAPLILDPSVKSSKISRTERHLYNSAAFKARTKLRNKVRDKRADVM
ncbi:hypothetical protein AALO_G00058380 [Alosa alosa]|uniref:Interferon-related developmental regulator 2 n=1 Tax=Alosa alosa TaxID=278164 RepID=A0AAV6HAR4_9TELE|nr:hypothetical protein AALO_G00058380 [Alosa alosa]